MQDRRIRWTEEEDTILLSNVEKSPQNILAACRKTSEETGRKVDACKARFNYIRNKHPERPFLVTVGRKKAIPNRKVKRKGCPVQVQPVKRSIWKQLLSWLGW